MQKLVTLSVCLSLLTLPSILGAQVYSPQVQKVGAPDTAHLKVLAEDIYRNAKAVTPREKAEAIWRYYLTDGRFVKPGVFYHLAGWAYEEPAGQVLDPVKLLNSYGFGLCYQDGPLMAATYLAGGFQDARVWFLTGHTVAEVFYDGAYHYFDSDMLGYNPIGSGPLKQRPVASVYQLEHDGNIMLQNMTGTTSSNPKSVDYPWYPADVRAGDMADIAGLFTSANDNYLYAYQRYPEGHTMDYMLRPGETMTRYFEPTPAGLFYLPYTDNEKQWTLLPDFAQFHFDVEKGPRSEKDDRLWATGSIEYRPRGTGDAAVTRQGNTTTITFAMPTPYVIIDAAFTVQASLVDTKSTLAVETSTDGGHTWIAGASLTGPYQGSWTSHPAEYPAPYGRRNAVAGSYGYLVRFSLTGGEAASPPLQDFLLLTRFQLNPRTLPQLAAGNNDMQYRSGSTIRTELPVVAARLQQFTEHVKNAAYQGHDGQGVVVNGEHGAGEIVLKIEAPHGGRLQGFAVGGRFLDLAGGLAPDKFTAETRKVTPWPTHRAGPGTASIAWSVTPDGPWTTLWQYDPSLTWLDGQPIPQVLRWPEVDRTVSSLPDSPRSVYVRYMVDGLAIDQFRLAAIEPAPKSAAGSLQLTQVWEQNGVRRSFHKTFEAAEDTQLFHIPIPEGSSVRNIALILACPNETAKHP